MSPAAGAMVCSPQLLLQLQWHGAASAARVQTLWGLRLRLGPWLVTCSTPQVMLLNTTDPKAKKLLLQEEKKNMELTRQIIIFKKREKE